MRVTRITRNITRECQTRVPNASERAYACDALPTRELKLASAKLENTCEYSQTNTRVLSIVLVSTCNRTRQHLQSNSPVLAIELASTRNHSRELQFLWVCHAIVLISSGPRAGWQFERIRGKLVPGDVLSCFITRDTVCERL